jgi:hypothetical protein
MIAQPSLPIIDRMQDQASLDLHRGTTRLVNENLAFRTFIVYLDRVLAEQLTNIWSIFVSEWMPNQRFSIHQLTSVTLQSLAG